MLQSGSVHLTSSFGIGEGNIKQQPPLKRKSREFPATVCHLEHNLALLWQLFYLFAHFSLQLSPHLPRNRWFSGPSQGIAAIAEDVAQNATVDGRIFMDAKLTRNEPNRFAQHDGFFPNHVFMAIVMVNTGSTTKNMHHWQTSYLNHGSFPNMELAKIWRSTSALRNTLIIPWIIGDGWILSSISGHISLLLTITYHHKPECQSPFITIPLWWTPATIKVGDWVAYCLMVDCWMGISRE